MTTVTWKNNADGIWSIATNWTPATPGSTTDVLIDTTAAHTITHSAGSDTILSLTVNATDTLAITGGSLRMNGNSAIAGAVTQSAGTLSFDAISASIHGNLTQTGGTIAIGSGVLSVSGASNTLDGTVIGTAVDFLGTQTTLGAGLALSVAEVLIGAGTVTLGKDFTAPGSWTQTAGLVFLAGHTLTLSGVANLDGGGSFGSGKIVVSGTGVIGGAGNFSFSGGGSAILDNTGRITQLNNLGLNAVLFNEASATYTIAGNSNIQSNLSTARLDNAGTLVKRGGGASQVLVATTSSGTITIQSGVLGFNAGLNRFGGTIGGGGTLQFVAGADSFVAGLNLNVGSVLLNAAFLGLGGNLTYAGDWTQTAGTFEPDGNALTLSGGAHLDGGTIDSSGTIAITGTADIGSVHVNGSVDIRNTGSIVQLSDWYLGSALGDKPTLENAAGATFTIANNASIRSGPITPPLINAGRLIKLDAGTSSLFPLLTNTGTITIVSGTLKLEGTAELGGTIDGAGTLQIDFRDSFDSDLSLKVAEVLLSNTLTLNSSIAYAGHWTETGGTLALGGHTLTLSGSADLNGGFINGIGTVAVTGSGEIGGTGLGGAAMLDNTGSITQLNSFSIGVNPGDTAKLVNAAGATFAIANSATINSGATAALLSNAGMLKKLGGGISQIHVATTNSGTIAIQSGVLSFNGGPDRFGGSIGGAGTLQLSAGSDNFLAGLSLKVARVALAGATLAVAGSLAYAGEWTESTGTLALAKSTLALSGNVDLQGGAIIGSGTLALGGTSEVGGVQLNGNVILANTGGITALNSFYIGATATDTSKLINTAVGTLAIASGANILTNATATSLSNAGTLIKLGSGLATIAPAMTSSGIIAIQAGTLAITGTDLFGGTVGGPGTLQLNGHASFAAGLSLKVGNVLLSAGTLTLDGNLAYTGDWTQAGGTLAVGGNTLGLVGAVQVDSGLITGAGTVAVTGTADFRALRLGGSVVLRNTGSIIQLSEMVIGTAHGDTAMLDNAAGATFTMANNTIIDSLTNTTPLTNEGTLIKVGSGTSTVLPVLTSTGTIIIASGTLKLGGTAELGGTISGAGTLQSDYLASFAPGLHLQVANVLLSSNKLTLGASLGYAGHWVQSGGTLALGGNILTLSGGAELNGGVINGIGTDVLSGASAIGALQVNGAAVLENTGSIVQLSSWFIGAAATDTARLVNATGATFDIAGDTSINSNATGALLSNAGTLIKTGSGGLSTIAVATINKGVVEVGSGGMTFLRPVSGGGSFVVDAGTTLTFAAAVAAGGKVSLGIDAELFVSATAGFLDSIANFAVGNIIETTGLAFAGAALAFNAPLDRLTVTNGASHLTLQLVGLHTAADFRLFSDGGVAAIAHS